MTRYTLVEHEMLPHFVVAARVTPKLEAKAKQHMGVIFDDYAKADTAADGINDWACVQALGAEPVCPNRTAHLTGFSSKCSIDGRCLYIPLTTPDTATQES
ncbi:hypothetical protein [Streptomyces sp. Wb2n-11]|uniref:hypothetical protein n=1 Tax=Streptomyces sp. Wb2n-11 TaxID=1030533 RepID=UPI000B148B9C|nr:hypothetical protein [Streptomyces sp. Wb2n-11]